jgi:hypothetical protein
MIRLILLVIAAVLFALAAFETFLFDMDWFNQISAGLFFTVVALIPWPDVAGPVVFRRREE